MKTVAIILFALLWVCPMFWAEDELVPGSWESLDRLLGRMPGKHNELIIITTEGKRQECGYKEMRYASWGIHNTDEGSKRMEGNNDQLICSDPNDKLLEIDKNTVSKVTLFDSVSNSERIIYIPEETEAIIPGDQSQD